LRVLRALWTGVTSALHLVGGAMTVVLLSLTYLIVVAPLGLLLPALRRPACT